MRINKRGQFYIIAAIIVVAVLIGVFIYGNYAKTSTSYNKVYDIGSELKIETGYVYDYGIYNGNETDKLIDQWTDAYYNYSQNAIEDWVFIYGNYANATVVYFTRNETGNICVEISGGSCLEMQKIIKGRTEASTPGNAITSVSFHGNDYPFQLKEGENFFFVIKAGGYVTAES